MFKKKNREIIIGSNNPGKIKEIRDLLPKIYKIFIPKDFNLNSPKENGKTFIQNSLIKAKYYSKKSDKIQRTELILKNCALLGVRAECVQTRD